ncbi:hypothetical protein LINPERHAP1_LOCUS24188 [Linum perenne]
MNNILVPMAKVDWIAYTIYKLNNGYLIHAMASWPLLSFHLITVDFKSMTITMSTVFNWPVANGRYSCIFVNRKSNPNLVGILFMFSVVAKSFRYYFNNDKRLNFNLSFERELADRDQYMFTMGQIMDRHGDWIIVKFILKGVTGEEEPDKPSRKSKNKCTTGTSDLITGQYQKVFHLAVAADKKNLFCDLLGRTFLNASELTWKCYYAISSFELQND